MNENEFEIGEDVELYIDNKEIIDNILGNYKKQCNMVREKLAECIASKFGENYSTYCSKYGFIQIWQKEWNDKNANGIHYEILCDFNNIIGYDTIVKFAIHNEGKARKIFPEIKHQTVKTENYKFDNSKNVEASINQIVDEIYNIAIENNDRINEIINKQG